MRIADLDILIVPASARLDADHWQARWSRNMRTARLVEVAFGGNGLEPATLVRIAAAVQAATRPVAIVAHGAGVAAVASAAASLPAARIAGAFLVAPISKDKLRRDHDLLARSQGWAALPFASAVVASSSSPDCTIEEARALASAWGSAFTEAGDCGRIDLASGHGPWPDGLLRFGVFLKSLDSPRLQTH